MDPKIKDKPNTLIKAIREAEKTANYMERKAELIIEKDYQGTLMKKLEELLSKEEFTRTPL